MPRRSGFEEGGRRPRKSAPPLLTVSSVDQESSTFKATTSFIMIVRDDEANYSKFSSSVTGLFDEMIVVNTEKPPCRRDREAA